jgi:hypothetical protein
MSSCSSISSTPPSPPNEALIDLLAEAISDEDIPMHTDNDANANKIVPSNTEDAANANANVANNNQIALNNAEQMDTKQKSASPPPPQQNKKIRPPSPDHSQQPSSNDHRPSRSDQSSSHHRWPISPIRTSPHHSKERSPKRRNRSKGRIPVVQLAGPYDRSTSPPAIRILKSGLIVTRNGRPLSSERQVLPSGLIVEKPTPIPLNRIFFPRGPPPPRSKALFSELPFAFVRPPSP